MNMEFTCPRLMALAAAATLAACGGSGGSSDSGVTITPPTATTRDVTAIGPITGFGSVYVNGIRFDTNGASYDVDDATASDDSALAVGMIVKIEGTVNADGTSGSADSVSYDDDVEGIVRNLATDPADADVKFFEVMGIDVRAERGTTNFDAEDSVPFDFDTLDNDDQVEASGYFSDGVLFATYMELQTPDDDDYEAKGIVSDYNGSDAFLLNLKSGRVLTVVLAPGAEIPSTGIENDLYVEVEGSIPDPVNAPDEVLAVEVEIEDEDRMDDDDSEIELKGTLTYEAATDTWSVLDIELAFDSDTEYEPESLRNAIADQSAAGLYVEVEGENVDGVLTVDEIEVEDGDIEMTGDVESKSGSGNEGSLTLSFGLAEGTVPVTIDGSTMFLDDDAITGFDLDSIMPGDKVEIDAREETDGSYVALVVRIEDDAGYEVEGPVDAFEDLVSITVIGVRFGVDANTLFTGSTPVVDGEAEVEDFDADGIADFVEADSSD